MGTDKASLGQALQRIWVNRGAIFHEKIIPRPRAVARKLNGRESFAIIFTRDSTEGMMRGAGIFLCSDNVVFSIFHVAKDHILYPSCADIQSIAGIFEKRGKYLLTAQPVIIKAPK